MSIGRAYTNFYREEARARGEDLTPPKDEYDHSLNLMLWGKSGVGKAHFCTRFRLNYFGTRHPPGPTTLLQSDSEVRKVSVDDKIIKINLFDNHYNCDLIFGSNLRLRFSSGTLLMYDITDKESYDSLLEFLSSEEAPDRNNTPMFLVGNKVDLPHRQVELDTAIDFARRNDMQLFETSAKDGTNVELAVMTMVAEIMKSMKKKKNCRVA